MTIRTSEESITLSLTNPSDTRAVYIALFIHDHNNMSEKWKHISPYVIEEILKLKANKKSIGLFYHFVELGIVSDFVGQFDEKEKAANDLIRKKYISEIDTNFFDEIEYHRKGKSSVTKSQ